LIYISRIRTRAIIFGTLFFLFNVIFMLQILSAGLTYLSDRYSFISYYGLCFLAGWSIQEIIKTRKKLKLFSVITLSFIIFLFLSLTFQRCKIWKNSESLWTDVIKKFPNETAIPYNNRGFFYNSCGQWNKAIYDCTRAIMINPKDVKAYSNRGNAYVALLLWGNAISDCSKIIEINPNDEVAYSNRGYAYGSLGIWGLAVSDCSKAIEINPNFSNAYSNRGRAYIGIREWDKALSDCLKALEINPGNTMASTNRAKALNALNR
jgi:protein O-mannosyl-transferase